MHLGKLSIIGFKNIRETVLEFPLRINCFVGDNGAGKTNMIDAVHYLSVCRSSLAMSDAQCVNHDRDFFLLDGQYRTDGGRRETVVCTFRKGGGKTLKRNSKEYEKLSEHIGSFPVVIVSPADSFLVTDAAEERRRYMNSFLSQLERGYLAAAVKYNHILSERNKLLKDPLPRKDILEILDLQLVEAGNVIHEKRAELVGRLAPLAGEFYAELSGDREKVTLEYRSELNTTPFEEILARSAERDRTMGFTTSGVHRDDLKMKIGGLALRKYGSQGQQKSFLIALKLAQYILVCEQNGEKPILLLDDVFDKLDPGRVANLLSLVAGGRFGQIFISECSRSRLEGILTGLGEGYSLFAVRNGEVEKI
ncbi:MAG: DNA replication and repair protein RecF [Rikenellaceae bacterium]|nr:DNA replication and repair protein RecF [Rikenellaceae bacterium]